MQNIFHYDLIIKKFRDFFQSKKKFIEVPAQSRLSILAACEDPKTISVFNFNNIDYPLPQTGQMWLEYELLKNPNVPGVFCITTSYRNEPNPISGRHDKIFPMFEFESHGSIKDLRKLIVELLEHFGFEEPVACLYNDMCKKYQVDTLEAEHETEMSHEYSNVITLEQFPQRSHPFWNMKHAGDNIYNKIDVLLYGMETFGAAERSVDTKEMRHYFLTISGGMYANLLFQKFGKERVLSELDAYLSLPMFPRFGGGIGVTRMERALKLANLLD
ncbi:MAG: TRNA ligase [uncultured bacterium]|nr:MAG: TRNA ligase [uncultured bacterium]